MVPIYDPESGETAEDARVCIDQNEFPDIPCAGALPTGTALNAHASRFAWCPPKSTRQYPSPSAFARDRLTGHCANATPARRIMRGFRIGRIFGVDVRVDWSWVFIFALLTWNLVAVFSRWHPDWAPIGAFVIAVAATLIFFGCLLLHELAHSVVAMRFGMHVRSITLFLFGGVSNIEQEPPSAKAEFFMAMVGPITSILLGIGAIVAASAVMPFPTNDVEDVRKAVARLGPVTTLLLWLGPINITIGIFNLIPGFPLDGGRILRSVLWGFTGDLRTATRWASTTGQTIGWLFIAGGIAMTFGTRLPLFGTGFAGGLWLAFIGWFLRNAASQTSTRLALDDVLAGMSVEQLMRREGPTVSPGLTVAALVHEHLIASDDRALPVVRDGVLLGLVSVSDVRKVPLEQWAATPVASIMQGVEMLRATSPGEPLAEAFERLATQDIEQLPVLENGRLVGMLRRRDVMRWLELAWRPAVRSGNSALGKRGANRDGAKRPEGGILPTGDQAHRSPKAVGPGGP
jgi:Zn-dependent protease/CBS domain-containing protein